MKQVLFLVFLLLNLVTETVFAERGDQYLLPKLGFMAVDLNDADSLLSVGMLYGYGISRSITFEGEANLGLSGGEYTRRDNSGRAIEAGDYRIWTVAGYGVYRLTIQDTAYFKGKVGLLYESIERSSDNNEGDSATGFGLAGGIGVGLIFRERLTLEFEATGIDESIIFYSLGIHYPF